MKKTKTINRRQFITKTAGVTAGSLSLPYIIPSSVLGRGGNVAPSNRITIGCIGIGGMGTGNMRSFLNQAGAQIVAVCDVDSNHLKRGISEVNTKQGNKDCSGYSDFRELINRKDIDALSLAIPDQWHAIISVTAARAGKDIYGEKPLAYTISEGRAIVDAVEKYGIVWQTGSWQRSQTHFRFACELVRNGRIGKIKTVRVGLPYGNSIREGSTQAAPVPPGFDYDMWLGPAPNEPYSPVRCHWNFRWISDYSGGQLTDWAGHHCDIANWGMDTELSAPVEIEGKADFPPAVDGLFDTPESYYFEAKYAEGFTMIVADQKQQPKGMGVHFIGSDGWIHVKRGLIDADQKSLLKSTIEPQEIHLYKSNDHHKNFLDCVKTRSKTVTPVQAAHRSIMIAHLGNIAMKLGRSVRWDPKNERFIKDKDADRMLSRPMRSPWHL